MAASGCLYAIVHRRGGLDWWSRFKERTRPQSRNGASRLSADVLLQTRARRRMSPWSSNSISASMKALAASVEDGLVIILTNGLRSRSGPLMLIH